MSHQIVRENYQNLVVKILFSYFSIFRIFNKVQ